MGGDLLEQVRERERVVQDFPQTAIPLFAVDPNLKLWRRCNPALQLGGELWFLLERQLEFQTCFHNFLIHFMIIVCHL